MAEEKKIPLILDVQGAKAIKTVGELKQGIADTRKELEKTEVGTKRFDELSASIKTAEGRLQDINKQSVFLKDLPGPIGMIAKGFDEAKTAIGQGVKALGTLRGAIAATGIGILLVAFASLQAYFTRTEEGAQKLRVIMAFLGAAVDKVADVFVKVGESMVNAFENPRESIDNLSKLIRENISNRIEGVIELFPRLAEAVRLALDGQFSKAGKVALDATAKVTLGIEDMTSKLGGAIDAMSDFAKEVIDTANAGAELEAALNRVIVKERELRVERAEANKTIAEQRNIAKDISLTLQERIAALTTANEMEQELLDRELSNERERLRIMEEKAALAKSDEDTLNAIADQQVKVANIEEQSLNKRRELQEQLTTLRREEEARAKEAEEESRKLAEERAAYELELQKQLRDARIEVIEEDREREIERLEAQFEDRLARIEEEGELETEVRAAIEEERAFKIQEIRDKYAKAEADANKRKNDELKRQEQELANAKIAAAVSVAGALGQIANAIEGQSRAAVAARKILAIAEIGISTAVAIAGAIKTATTGSTNPWEMIAAIASGIAAVVAGIAGATKILNETNVPGAGSASMPSAPSIPSAPNINPVTTNTTEIGNTEQAELAPIQAFVVETQITGSQNNVNQIESQATFA